MKAIRLVCLFCLLVASAVAARAADPVVRVEILTKPPIVAGQQVQVQVDVLVPNFFMSPPQFPALDIPNAIAILSDERAQNLVETINGEAYAGISQLYIVTPQVAGEYTIPSATITFAYAAIPGQRSDGSVTLPPTKFTVTGAPGAEGTQAAVASVLTVEQALDGDPAQLKVGDTLVRTVTVNAQGMRAMMIPVPDFTAPEGVRLYPHDPVLSDKQGDGRGPAGAMRVDRVTYAFEKPGSYVLPAVEISWYDPAAGKREVARAPEVTAVVTDAAAFKPAIAPPAEASDDSSRPWRDWLDYLPWAIAGLAALALLAWFARRAWPRLHEWQENRRLERQNSEAAFFELVGQAGRSGDPATIYARLDSWARRAGAIPIGAWLARNGDAAALSEFERLEKSVYSGKREARFDAQALLAGLAAARRNWLAKDRPEAAARPALPELNT